MSLLFQIFMTNINKQIEYWKNSAQSNFETAEILFGAGKYIECMFFCHLTIEKFLKALVVKHTHEIPPKSHDLFYLSKTGKIDLTEEQSKFMQILLKYQLEGRYPEFYPKPPSRELIKDYIYKTKVLSEWFNKML